MALTKLRVIIPTKSPLSRSRPSLKYFSSVNGGNPTPANGSSSTKGFLISSEKSGKWYDRSFLGEQHQKSVALLKHYFGYGSAIIGMLMWWMEVKKKKEKEEEKTGRIEAAVKDFIIMEKYEFMKTNGINFADAKSLVNETAARGAIPTTVKTKLVEKEAAKSKEAVKSKETLMKAAEAAKIKGENQPQEKESSKGNREPKKETE